jgi:hypothetical protein
LIHNTRWFIAANADRFGDLYPLKDLDDAGLRARTFTGTSEPHQVGIISASRTGNLAVEYAALEEIA